jgi:glutamate 5-kinase
MTDPRKIVVKVGTQSILSHDGKPFLEVISHLVEQLVAMKRAGCQLVLVSSGAVSSGRRVAHEALGLQYGNSIAEKQLLASLGQYELMHLYASIFKKHKILVSQLLLTKQDFHTRQHYLNISRLLSELLLHQDIIPIVNENDSVAIEELMFTDNDELAGLIAAQLNADKLIILSNIDGVFNKNPNEPDAELISMIDPKNPWPDISSSKSTHGRGGMLSKLHTARKMSSLGIKTQIANIKEPSALLHLLEDKTIGTTILPGKKKSNLKRWMAYSEETVGTITINACFSKILKENKEITSILPIGIERFTGQFKRGDLIEIFSANHEKIGVGLAKYNANELMKYLQKPAKPAFIHYDHLYLF